MVGMNALFITAGIAALLLAVQAITDWITYRKASPSGCGNNKSAPCYISYEEVKVPKNMAIVMTFVALVLIVLVAYWYWRQGAGMGGDEFGFLGA